MRTFSHDIPLSEQEIRTMAPSVYASKPAAHVSQDYHFVNTGEVLGILNREGWEPFSVKQQKVRSEERKEGTKHMVMLRNSRISVTGMDIGGLLPTFTLVNSHDWSSRFKVMVGIYRLVCSNGMMVSSGIVQGFNIRHDHITEDIEVVMARFSDSATKILEMAQAWDSIMLDEATSFEFARKAAVIRFGEESQTLDAQARALLYSRRYQDDKPSLWNTFNRIQENSIKGGGKSVGMKRRIRALSNIDAEVDVNNNLFNLAATFDPFRVN